MSLLRFARHSFPERGRGTLSSSHRSTPTYATFGSVGKNGAFSYRCFREWDLKGKGFQLDTQTPTPMITFELKDQSLGAMRCIEYLIAV
jgi:hypothetical protein